mgnify:CR=1 FL=1
MSWTSKCRMLSVRRPRLANDGERFGQQIVERRAGRRCRSRNSAVFARSCSSVSA